MKPLPLIVILGPTASGKTQLAVAIAAAFDGEVISADSRQVFKDMTIGTGKDLAEYQQGDKNIPYHLIDILEAGQKYNVNQFKEDFYKVFAGITSRNKLAVLCGGSGHYINTILQDYEFTAVPANAELRKSLEPLEKDELINKLSIFNSEYTAHADLSSHKRLIRAIEVASYLESNQLGKVVRPEIDPLIIGLKTERPMLRKRIQERLTLRLQNGLIEEVEKLIQNGISEEMLNYYGLEYKLTAQFLRGAMDYSAYTSALFTAICQFAKRQSTFFRKMEKDGILIHWVNVFQDKEKIFKESQSLVLNHLSQA